MQAVHSVKFSARQDIPRPLCTKLFVNSDLMTMLARMDSLSRGGEKVRGKRVERSQHWRPRDDTDDSNLRTSADIYNRIN